MTIRRTRHKIGLNVDIQVYRVVAEQKDRQLVGDVRTGNFAPLLCNAKFWRKSVCNLDRCDRTSNAIAHSPYQISTTKASTLSTRAVGAASNNSPLISNHCLSDRLAPFIGFKLERLRLITPLSVLKAIATSEIGAKSST